MTALEQAIRNAFNANGKSTEANKAYLEFTKANFMMPIEGKTKLDATPIPLYLLENKQVYLPIFNNETVFDHWIKDIADEVDVLRLSGVDLLKGIGEEVHVCLNIGSDSYKLFLPSEIARMRSLVLKLFS